ncbi:MAG: hypothetical protein EZS28_036856, partial [Streblomastix strix]
MQERKNERDSNPESDAIHKVNLEEKHPFILNLFYCFFLPFICRVKPITNDDIYQIGKKDRCDYTSDKTLEGWGPKYAQYLINKAKFDKYKLENP